MKTTISPEAVEVLRAIAGNRKRTWRQPILSVGEAYAVTVNGYPFYFRAAAADTCGRRIAFEATPGFGDGAAIGLDLDGKAWIAYQSEVDDRAFSLADHAKAAQDAGEAPGAAIDRERVDMACHMVRLFELSLLALKPEQVAELTRQMSVRPRNDSPSENVAF